MKHFLTSTLIAGALAGAALFATAAQASAHDYRTGVSVYVGSGYYRSGYRDDDDWRWRHRCYRYYRHDCGNHYGWRNRWRGSDWRDDRWRRRHDRDW